MTVTEAGPDWLLTVPSRVAVAPVFVICPQVAAAVVVPVTETVTAPKAGTLRPVQLSAPPATLQLPWGDVVVAVESQTSPLAEGSVSPTATFVAVTLVVFVTVNVQPIFEPEFTEPAGLATLAIVMAGQLTVTFAGPESLFTPLTVARA